MPVRRTAAILVQCTLLWASLAEIVTASEPPFVAGRLNYDLATEYVWGFATGLKQPLGAYQNGLSVHQITQSEYGTEPPPSSPPFLGNPDHIFWVDEHAGTFGISSGATGQLDGAYVNPGGMVALAPDGTLWYTLGGRAQELPLDLYRSDTPYGIDAFSLTLDDYSTITGSTCPCVNVHGSNVLLFWRHLHSAQTDGKVAFRRYDIDVGFDVPQKSLSVGTGGFDDDLGPIGIEQVWSRFDPRFNYTFVTWTYFDLRDGDNPAEFGAHPFLYSDDDGDTWRIANGEPLTDLPLSYSETNELIVPYDHLALGMYTDWQLFSDMGVSPNGTFWTAVRCGHFKFENMSYVSFFRFDGTQWQSAKLTANMHSVCKPHAVGVTKDYLVFLYSEYEPDHVLKARLSADDGVTWTAPVTLRVLEPSDVISWISFVQPADGYDDNSARFFYSYCGAGYPARRWRNAVSWIRVDVGGTRGDCNGDGEISLTDVESFTDCMTGPVDRVTVPECHCADLDVDGDVDLLDWLAWETRYMSTLSP